MNIWVKIISVMLFFFATGIASYQYGLMEGFGRGYTFEAIHRSTTEALRDTRVLNDLREGNVDSAIDIVEMHLDGEILVHHIGLVNKPKRPILLVNSVDGTSAIANIMSLVSKYRKKYPSSATDTGIKNSIDSVVNHYAKD